MREDMKVRFRQVRDALLGGWDREIRHPDARNEGNRPPYDPNHPIR